MGKPTASASATSSPWINKALGYLATLHETHSQVTGEDVRFWLKSRRVKAPASPQSYGALIQSAIRAGILARTNKTRMTVSKTSHSWSTPVYNVRKPRQSGGGLRKAA
jgi:hypothetical protein